MYVVVAYDVTDDRRRRRLAKRLIDFLPRVQRSVFEGELPDRRLPQLERVLRDGIDPEVDSVRVYRLCRRCREVVIELGCWWEPGAAEEDAVV